MDDVRSFEKKLEESKKRIGQAFDDLEESTERAFKKIGDFSADVDKIATEMTNHKFGN